MEDWDKYAVEEDSWDKYAVGEEMSSLDKRISERPSAFALAGEGVNQIAQDPKSLLNVGILGNQNPIEKIGLGVIGGVGQRLESAVANPILAKQQGRPEQMFSDFLKGLSGERRGELGDIVRQSGVGGKLNEPLAVAGGLAASALLLKGASKLIPTIYTDKKIADLATRSKDLSKGMGQSINQAYGSLYSKVNPIKVDPTKIDEVLLRNKVPDYVLQEIDQTVGRVDTVEKAKRVSDILRGKTPQTILKGSVRGKGGLGNKGIRMSGAAPEVKGVMNEAIAQVDPKLAEKLTKLDRFAFEKYYPTLDKVEKIANRGSSEGFTSAFSGNPQGASRREASRLAPTALRELKSFLDKGLKGDLSKLAKEAGRLNKELRDYQARQLFKKVILNPISQVGIGAGVVAGAGALRKE